jgi:hypothetical protein
VEWKFARSLLYMEYIGDGGTLPPPVNILGTPKAVLRAIFCRCDCRSVLYTHTRVMDEIKPGSLFEYP